jgi:hypothetical protein
MGTDPARYRIRVKGQLGPEWSEWFGGMSISCDGTNETTLSGQVVDQAALVVTGSSASVQHTTPPGRHRAALICASAG